MECHECGETISDKAADCPHCGTSVRSVDDAGSDLDSPAADDDPLSPDEHDESPATQPTRPMESDSLSEDVDSPTEGRREGESGDSMAGEGPLSGDRSATGGTADETEATGDDFSGAPAGTGDDEPTDTTDTVGGAATGMGDGTSAATSGQTPPATGEEKTVGDRETAAGGQVQQDVQGSHDEASGFDAEEFVGRLPFFPGAAAGFATGVILLTIAVAYAAMIPNAQSSTLALGGLVFLDLQFATTGHVTPALFRVFEVVSPRQAALGFLYLFPPLGLYTAAKLVVSFNSDAETTLPESIVGGLTVLPGYLPVVLVAFILASPEGFVAPSIVGLVIAAVVYPVVVGVVGGLAGGGLSGSERRVGTLYGFGAAFFIALGCFVATFIAAVPASESPSLLTHVLLGTFSYVAVNVFAFGGGQVIGAAGVLALFVVGLTMVAATVIRAWRASDNDSALRGVAKGTTLAPTYFVVLGFYTTLVPWLSESYIRDQIGIEFLAAGYADFIVRMRLSGIADYVLWVLVGTVVFAVFLGGVSGGVATLLRAEMRDE